jgi:WD40 repeat protein
MSPIGVRRLLLALSGRLLLVAIALLAFLLAGCSSKTATLPPGTPSDDIRLTAQAIMATLQAASSTPVSRVAAVRATPVPSAATVMLSPSLTPRPSSPTLQPTSVPVTPEPVRLTRLAWSPDGKLLAVGSATGVYLYDTATWEEVRFIPLSVGEPSSSQDQTRNVAFSHDGVLLATEAREIQIWRVADGSFVYGLKGQRALAASPTEGLWATHNGYGGSAGRLQLWRTSDGQLVRELAAGREYGVLQDVFFSPDGRLIATTAGDADGFVVSRVTDGRVLSKAPENTLWWDYGVDLAFRASSNTMVYIGRDDMLGLWDATTGTLIKQLSGPGDMTKGPVAYRVDFAPDGASFATLHSAGPGVEGGTIQIWHADGTRSNSWPLTFSASDIGFSRDGRLLAVLAGQSFYLYNPDDGSMARQVEPVWHQGILPTPTPTPLALGLDLPVDWKEYYALGGSEEFHFKIRIPPTWVQEVEGVSAFMVAPSSADGLTPKLVQIHRGYCGPTQDELGSQPSLDSLKRMWAPNSEMESVFVAGGKWPLLIPATYAEFDLTYNLQGPKIASAVAHRKTRLIVLDWRFQGGASGCVTAWLEDELGDISEQDRLDFSRVVASIQSGDDEHPLPTATPTFTPTPNPAPQPALPLQILFDAKTSLSSSGGGSAEITIEIKDVYGNPVNDAEVTLSCGWGCNSIGLSREGRFTSSYGSTSSDDQTLTVEVRWNQELIAQQKFVISWHESPTAQPKTTSTPVTIIKVTDVPSPKPLARPTVRACAVSVAGEFADLYEKTRLGCPTGNAQTKWGAWETFERGAMLWRSDTDEVYAFGQQGARSWLKIPDRWNGQEIKGRGNPPPGLQTPVRGFGYVWGERDDIFALLGWATDQERGFCFTLQPFERGFLMRSNPVQSCTPENYYNQATAPDWKPVSLAAYEGGWSDRRPAK